MSLHIPNRLALWLRKRGYLLYEPFNGTAINSARWNVTDAEGKVSVGSGNLVFSGGYASADQFAPAAQWVKTLPRIAGMTIEFSGQSAATTTYGPRLQLCNTATPTNINTEIEHSVYPDNNGMIVTWRLGFVDVTPMTYSAATWKYLRLVLLDTGCLYYGSNDKRTWDCLGYDAAGTITPLYVRLHDYDATACKVSYCNIWRRAVPSPLSRIDTPTGVTPTLVELFTDPGLEAWDSATNLTSWTEQKAGTSTVNRENTVVHAGSYAVRLDIDASDNYAQIGQTPTVAAGTWLKIGYWAKASTAGKSTRIEYGGSIWLVHALTTSYQQFFGIRRAAAANPNIVYTRQNGAQSTSLYIDDVFEQVITWATTFGSTSYAREANSEVSFLISTLTAGTQAGMAIKYVDANNCCIVYHDGATAFVIEYVGGTYGLLASQAVAYNAATLFSCKSQDGKLRVYYGSTAIGGELTENVAYKDATEMRAWSTLDTNRINTMKCWGKIAA
jgi:hypothetical protein